MSYDKVVAGIVEQRRHCERLLAAYDRTLVLSVRRGTGCRRALC